MRDNALLEILRRVKFAAALWLKAAAPILLVSFLLVVPGVTWSLLTIQKAEARLQGAAGPWPAKSRGEHGAAMALAIVVNLAAYSLGTSCILSAMEAVKAGKTAWLGRGLRRSLRLLGWELLVTLQALIRAFVPIAPAPSGSRPEEFYPPEGSVARWLDRTPILAGAIFYFCKMGLLSYVAVLTTKRWHECAGVARGHYLHIGFLNALNLVVRLTAFALMSPGSIAEAGAEGAPAWVRMAGIVLAEQIGFTLLTAYGLLLYHAYRQAASRPVTRDQRPVTRDQ